MSRPDEDRSALLATLLRNSGERCPAATRNFYRGLDADNAAIWTVHCASGKDWEIAVEQDGKTKLLDCAFMDMLEKKRGSCWTAF